MLPSVSTWASADQMKILLKSVRGMALMGPASLQGQRQQIADVAHGLDAALEIALGIELAAHLAHERVDVAVDARGLLAGGGGGPELVPGHDLAGGPREGLQEV